MRKLIIALAVAVASATTIAAAVAQSGKAPARAEVRPSAAAGNDSARVASALALTAAQTAVLAKAQALGREATRCLLANGATRGPESGIPDPTGAATAACQSELQTNDAFLNSAEFAALLRTAQPRFEAASRCFSRVSGVPRGTIIHSDELTPALQRRVEEATSQCFRADGLPR